MRTSWSVCGIAKRTSARSTSALLAESFLHISFAWRVGGPAVAGGSLPMRYVE